MLNSVYQGDCLDVMATLPDGVADMILCDLPYGTTKNTWDVTIPLEAMWAEFWRVVKPAGAVVLFGQGLFTARLMASCPEFWRYNLIWQKDRVSGFLNAKRMPLRSHEDIADLRKETPMLEGKTIQSAHVILGPEAGDGPSELFMNFTDGSQLHLWVQRGFIASQILNDTAQAVS